MLNVEWGEWGDLAAWIKFSRRHIVTVASNVRLVHAHCEDKLWSRERTNKAVRFESIEWLTKSPNGHIVSEPISFNFTANPKYAHRLPLERWSTCTAIVHYYYVDIIKSIWRHGKRARRVHRRENKHSCKWWQTEHMSLRQFHFILCSGLINQNQYSHPCGHSAPERWLYGAMRCMVYSYSRATARIPPWPRENPIKTNGDSQDEYTI